MGSDLAPGLNNIFPQETFLDPLHSAFYQSQATTGSSPFIYLGFAQGYEAQGLVKFLPTNTFPDSFSVDSLIVSFYLDSVMVAGASPLQISVIPLSQEQTWNEIGVIWDSTESWQLGDPIASLQAPTETGDSVEFPLSSPDSLLRAWISAMSSDSIDYNNGFYLRVEKNGDNLIRLGSGESVTSTLRPKLEMQLTAYDSTDSGYVATEQIVSLYAIYDTFVARDQSILDPSRLYIGNAATYRSNLYFNLDGLFPPYGTSIQRAEVILHADTTSSANLGAIAGAFTLAMADTSWLINPATASIKFGSVPIVGALNSDAATLTINMTSLVYGWISNPGTNFGFLVQSSSEFYDISRTVFYGIEAADSLKPKMRIVYLENQP
ncbi:MAG: DNRLRE domain-containing protein [bacterium]|nr:DNRLRE domain-containing protein [bacterium]